MEQKTITKQRSLLAKLGRGLAIFLLSLIGLIVLILILIQTAPVQSFARKKIVGFLETKLQTRVEIGRLDIDFPKMLVLENVFFEDKRKDTLLAGKQLKVDLDMFKLISSEVQINEINLHGITTKIRRQLPDTTFNFQFILDAFVPADSTPQVVDTAAKPMKMAINKIIIDKSRVVYDDIVTGNDVDVYLEHFDTNIETFDLENLKFEVPKIALNGVRGHVKQTKPLLITAVSTAPTKEDPTTRPKFLEFINRESLISDISLFYSNAQSGIATQLSFADLNLYPGKIDLEKTDITLEKVELEKLNGWLKMGPGEADVVKLTNQNKQEVSEEVLPFIFRINEVRFNDNNFKFDDATKPRMARGMDYAHLDITNLTLHADDFVMRGAEFSGVITEGKMKEKSGFVLNTLKTRFNYTDKGASLEDLLIETPGTRLQKRAVVKYPSLVAVQNNVGLMELDIDVDDSKIMVKDILVFAPQLAAQPAFSNPNATLFVDSRIRGSVSKLFIDEFRASGIGATRLDVSGQIYGLPNANNVTANLSIREMKTTRRDIYSFVPANTIPSNITVPESLSLTGTLKGGMNRTFADLNLNTSLGAAAINGDIANPTNPKAASYNARVTTRGLNIGTLIQNPQMGKITATLRASGRGFDPKAASANVSGNIASVDFNKYVYRNVALNAKLANQRYTATTSIKDPNIDLFLDASGSLAGKFPGINVKAQIDSIKTLPLGFTPDAMIYRGNIVANFPELNPDALTGKLFVTQSLLVKNGQRIELDTLEVIANHTGNNQFLSVQTPFINARLDGQYKLTQLGTIIQSTIQPYFAIAPKNTVFKTDPYNFNINVTVVDHPTIKAFVPDLKMEPVTIAGNLSNVAGMNLTMNAPGIIMGTQNINGVVLTAATEANALRITTTLNQYTNGPNMALYNTSLNATLANNQLNFGLLIKDKATRDKYRLNGSLLQETPSTYVFSLAPDSLMLNYARWTASAGNMIRYTGKDIIARNFALSQANQTLSINSVGTQPNSPLQVSLTNFNMATLTGFVQTDSLLVDGTINGNVLLQNVLTQPSFTSDLVVNNLALKRDTIGDVAIKVNNTTQNVFATDVRITGRGNDVALTGNYYLKPANNSNMDLNLRINQLPFKTIEAFSMGALTNASGNLTGSVDIDGLATAPKIDGSINFNNTAFNVVMLGSLFKIDNEAIKVNNEGISFNTFTIKDSADNTLIIDGIARTSNFTNYRFDMRVRARDFRAMNSPKTPAALYYGKLYLNTNLGIKGTETAPIVDGTLRINEKTDLTLVMPQAEPGVVDRKGVIEFVDMDVPGNDSLFKQVLAKYDSSFNNSSITGMDVTLNVEVVKDATFNVVIDEANGDFLKLKGEALLNAGIDPSGKTTLTGTYELESGGYELSFNFIRRKFDIEKGSKITFTGEPTDATLDVTAVYIANTNSLDLVGPQVQSAANNPMYLQKLPFQVRLMLDGELMQPTLTFEIGLEEGNNNARVSNEVLQAVNTRLEQLKNEPSELNKQVFALLLLNRFINENPFESSGSGFDAALYAKQSVSKILTQQLNNLASDLIAGVDISFDVNSSEDYSTGARATRTDFNVALSKRLLNDRLKVTVGNNFELEGPQRPSAQGNTGGVVGNIALDYQLTPDGRYAVRAYRKNEYEAVVEGFVIEQGLKFIMTVDYNRFKEIFDRRRTRRQLKKQEKADSTSVQTTTTFIGTPPATIEETAPVNETDSLTDNNKTVADDRKTVPAIDKVSTDEY